MRIQDHRADDAPEINLIPLIDVLLCLLIFFVVTTTFDARSVLKLELPRADGQPADPQARPLSILLLGCWKLLWARRRVINQLREQHCPGCRKRSRRPVQMHRRRVSFARHGFLVLRSLVDGIQR